MKKENNNFSFEFMATGDSVEDPYNLVNITEEEANEIIEKLCEMGKVCEVSDGHYVGERICVEGDKETHTINVNKIPIYGENKTETIYIPEQPNEDMQLVIDVIEEYIDETGFNKKYYKDKKPQKYIYYTSRVKLNDDCGFASDVNIYINIMGWETEITLSQYDEQEYDEDTEYFSINYKTENEDNE